MIQPLTKADISKIRQAIARNRELEQFIEIVLATGLPCDEQSEKCKWAKGILEKLNESFSPMLLTH